MKHINKFNSINEAINSTAYSPNVSLILGSSNPDNVVYTYVGENTVIKFEADDLNYVIGKLDETKIPLTFIGKDTENSIRLQWSNGSDQVPEIEIEVFENGEWRPYSIIDGTGETINIATDGSVKFRGANTNLGNNGINYWKFVMTGEIEASGNIISILDRTCNLTELPNYAFAGLFYDCSALTLAPELPFTTLAIGCYSGMFYGCTSLTATPELPAMTLAQNCYGAMFCDCSSLTTAPELPATELAMGCYSVMFLGCTSLTELTVYADDITAEGCLDEWLSITAFGTTGTLHSLGSADFTGKVPSNWTIVQN